MHADLPQLEAQIEGQLAHEILCVAAGVGERPVDRELPQLAVVRGDVGAAAVFEVASDCVVVVAVDRGDTPLGDQRADLVGVWSVADQVAAAVDAFDTERVDPRERGLKRGKVAVYVRDDRRGTM